MVDRPRLLDLCSCSGIGADGYKKAGFEVLCLDNDEKALQHNPHETICGDALVYLKDRKFMAQFDAVHGSFPCQLWTAAQELAKAQGKRPSKKAVDLLSPGLSLLWKLDIPWVVENVERSPLKHMEHLKLCGTMFGLQVQRHRLFVSNFDLEIRKVCDHSTFPEDPVSGKPRPWGVYYAKGDNIPSGGRTCLTVEHAMECMGVKREVPWEYLCESIPPAYTHHIGKQLKQAI